MSTLPSPPDELVLAGARLVVLRTEHWPLEQALSNESDVVRWTFYPERMSEAQARARLLVGDERAAAGISKRYAVIGGAGPIGVAGIAQLDGPVPEVVYALLPQGRGRGLATAAATCLSDWLLANGRAAVALITVEGNAASERVAQRSGFELREQFVGDHRGTDVRLKRWVRERAG